MEILDNREDSDEKNLHLEYRECECAECQNKRECIQIIDVDSYVDSLNDWD